MDRFFSRFFPDDGDATVGYLRVIDTYLDGARSVLDLGCGDNTHLAPYRAPGRAVWGVDFQAHPRLAHPEWFRPLGPGGEVPFPADSFDLIGARWVLEHVREPRHLLAEVRRLLRPGGRFIALTVNAGHYVTLASRLLRLLPHGLTQRLIQRLYGRACHDTFPTFYRMNSQAAVRRLARRAGLHVVRIDRFANADYFSFAPLLRRGAIVADWLLERAGTDLGRLYLVMTLQKPANVASNPGKFSAAA